jgi:cysteinyl-tRNA synthetase
MSKSLGNYYTVRDIINDGYDPLSLRYFYLTGHYRSQIDFTIENLQHARNSLQRLKNIIMEIKDDRKTNTQYLKKFEAAMDDDFDTVKALEVLWELVRDENADGKIETIKKIDSVLGLALLKKEKVSIPAVVKKFVDEREKARKEKNWSRADELREKIKEQGFYVNDTAEGPKVSRM